MKVQHQAVKIFFRVSRQKTAVQTEIEKLDSSKHELQSDIRYVVFYT